MKWLLSLAIILMPWVKPCHVFCLPQCLNKNNNVGQEGLLMVCILEAKCLLSLQYFGISFIIFRKGAMIRSSSTLELKSSLITFSSKRSLLMLLKIFSSAIYSQYKKRTYSSIWVKNLPAQSLIGVFCKKNMSISLMHQLFFNLRRTIWKAPCKISTNALYIKQSRENLDS